MDNNAKWKTFTINDKIRIIIQVHVPVGIMIQTFNVHTKHNCEKTMKNLKPNNIHSDWLKK
jgi:hypothetical protein